MKRFLALFGVLLMCVISTSVFAQEPGNQEVKKISELNGQSIYLSSLGIRLTDSDAAGGPYGSNENYVVTLYDTNCSHPNRLCFRVDEFNIHPSDTLYIHDGPNTASPLLYKGNNSNSAMSEIFYATGDCLTIRFRSDGADTARGFVANILCSRPCQKIVLNWDSVFYKIIDDEEVPFKVTNGFDLDTLYDSITGITTFDTNRWQSFDICDGDRIAIPVVTEFPENGLYYHQSDEYCRFKWNFGDGDTVNNWGANVVRHSYGAVQGYDLFLTVTDSSGCQSTKSMTARVRIARNPIKTLFDLPTICNTSYATISVGASSSATIITQPLEFVKEAMKENDSRTFVPDGPHCENPCFYAPVNFTEFPSGRQIQSASDICAICVNMEHEYMGDIEITIVCPEERGRAVLKYKPNESFNQVLNEWENPGGGGGSKFFGIPYGGGNHDPYDGSGDEGYCDSLFNIPGVCWNYCWSNSRDYGYWDVNRNMDADISNAIYVINDAGQVQVTHDFGTTLPPGYNQTGNGCGEVTCNTTDSSHRAEKLGFYKPSQGFDNLVGCDLNGEWNIEVCDTWGVDNGWVFSWSMELCNISTSDWTYNVGIDSVLWSERTPGVRISTEGSTQGRVTTPDTAGYFLLNVSIIDSFGCQWDTCTGITTVWEPRPNLGNDTAVCDDESFLLNADDGRAYKYNYSYMWSPTYETTQKIWTLKTGGIATTYEVEVSNTMHGISCSARDNKVIDVAPKPIPNFNIVGLPFVEGCEPLDIQIENRTVGAAKHLWVYGDGHTSTEASPKHTYYAGNYDFYYYATSDRGCVDSIKYDDFVSVFSSPKAKFTWEPETPTVLHPDVQFKNLTMPHNSDNIYYWKIQYDKDITHSVTTLKEAEPLYTFKAFDDQSIAGKYNIELIALTKNLAPSGNYITCADTTGSSLVLVNDFLQFPNVVTPNGDGINDVFEIINLVDGLGYPTNELSIFDRWGKRVFHKENISSKDEFWDPGANNAPAGTYFYRFVGKGYLGNIQRNGVIEVIK